MATVYYTLVASEMAGRVSPPMPSQWVHSLDALFGLAVGIAGCAVVVYLLIRAGVVEFRGKGEDRVQQPIQMCPVVCVEHGGERERSLTNQRNITALWDEFKALRKDTESHIREIQKGQNQIILGLVKAGLLDYHE